MAFKIVITLKAQIDILEGIEWYDKQAYDLGKRFYQTIQANFKILCINPFFQVRYEDVRCLPLEKYPYMVHFVIDEEREQVIILGIICTHRGPKNWVGRNIR